MPTIVIKPDNVNDLNRNYAQTPLTAPVFLNSVPKCGTHLMRNIIRMFVPVEQQYHQTFIQHVILRKHLAAFSPAADVPNELPDIQKKLVNFAAPGLRRLLGYG